MREHGSPALKGLVPKPVSGEGRRAINTAGPLQGQPGMRLAGALCVLQGEHWGNGPIIWPDENKLSSKPRRGVEQEVRLSASSTPGPFPAPGWLFEAWRGRQE